MAGPLGEFDYISDDGNTYAVRMDASNAAAVGASAATTAATMSRRYRPRYLLAKHPTTGRERRIIVPDPTETVWTTTAVTTLALIDVGVHPSVSTNYQVAGRVGERRYK